MISRIVLQNFKRFTSTEILCNNGKNIFIGENGAGKSTLLQAIGLVLSGSHSQIEKVSLASLMNSTAVSKFLAEKGILNSYQRPLLSCISMRAIQK